MGACIPLHAEVGNKGLTLEETPKPANRTCIRDKSSRDTGGAPLPKRGGEGAPLPLRGMRAPTKEGRARHHL